MKYTITKRKTKNGSAFDLYFRFNGKRYRPVLGYDLDKLAKEEIDRLAIAKIHKILGKEEHQSASSSASPTFRDFLPVFWQTMRVKQRFDCADPNRSLKRTSCPDLAIAGSIL